MSILRKIKRVARGDVNAKAVALEVIRRSSIAIRSRRERATLSKSIERRAALRPSFTRMPAAELLAHFRLRTKPLFMPGFSRDTESSQLTLFPEETRKLLESTERIVNNHAWPLLGLGEKNFGEQINWHLDPISAVEWPLEYHGNLNLFRSDGSDVRVLWELNRMSQVVQLARAYALTNDERFTAEFFAQVESWRAQNPYGYGANWNCAMEVALRAMNLLGAFEVFRHSPLLNKQNLANLLATFDQHGAFIRSHLEFSYLATSNHYLSNVVGLLWLGILLPELAAADEWRAFGLREMLREMNKQVLPDGVDFESSTGYHRFVLELFSLSFILCRANKIEIEAKYWEKLHQMFGYVRAYLRPDGHAPLIGDCDSGQVFPIRAHAGDDHAYVLAIGAVMFQDSNLKDQHLGMPEELLWTLGEQGVAEYRSLAAAESAARSESFSHGGIHLMRDRDLYLLLNTSGAGISGRGSHGHNDALSIEVSACGHAFIVDPGSSVYTANLKERHDFRSTAYHSTVQVDGIEQNTIEELLPFVIGNEARPKVLTWETGAEWDRISAEHCGYLRLPEPVTHRRTITFDKGKRSWLVEDEFFGIGKHDFAVRFHFDEGIQVSVLDDWSVMACHLVSGTKLYLRSLDIERPLLERQFTSRDYGSKVSSITVCWKITTTVSCKFQWELVPVDAGENEADRLGIVQISGQSLKRSEFNL